MILQPPKIQDSAIIYFFIVEQADRYSKPVFIKKGQNTFADIKKNDRAFDQAKILHLNGFTQAQIDSRKYSVYGGTHEGDVEFMLNRTIN